MIPVSQSRVDANWKAITIELDAPRPGRLERSLRRFGIPSEATRVMAATPALRRSWFVALAIVSVVGLLAAGADQPRDAFFNLAVLAPLVPVIGIALAYGPTSDPAREIELATPSKGLRLLLLRAVTIQALSTVVLGLVSLASPIPVLASLGWMLPSLGVTSIAVVLMTVLAPGRAASVGGGGWLIAMLVAGNRLEHRLDAFGPSTQVLGVFATVVCMGLLYAQRERFDVLQGPR